MPCPFKCKNIGNNDRAFRLFIGFMIMAYGIYFNNATLVGISFIPLVTGLLKVCPIYKLFNINTTDKNSSCSINNNSCDTNNKASNNNQTNNDAKQEAA